MDSKVEEVALTAEEVEVDLADLTVVGVVMEMMVVEVVMEVEEDMGIEEAMVDEAGMEVGAAMVLLEEVDHHQEEEEDTALDQGRDQDPQSDELEEGIVQNTVERDDTRLPDLGLFQVGAGVEVLHLGERRALVGVSADPGQGAGVEVRSVERGVIAGVSVGAGVDRLCRRSRLNRGVIKRSNCGHE